MNVYRRREHDPFILFDGNRAHLLDVNDCNRQLFMTGAIFIMQSWGKATNFGNNN